MQAAFTSLPNLASSLMGARVVEASDDFFADKENLIKPADPIFIPGKFTENGKWMDGWESRRRRSPGHDFCIVRLGVLSRLRGVDIDTAHFTGNFPESASVEVSRDGRNWTPVIAPTLLKGNAHHLLDIASNERWLFVKLNIFPDGGVARLRVYGHPAPDLPTAQLHKVDLACLTSGGQVLCCNDEHFGSRHHLILPGQPANMGEGWETKRRRGPGHDWIAVELARPAAIARVEIDTMHFKGNYPDSCTIEAFLASQAPSEADIRDKALPWQPLLPQQKLGPHQNHVFDTQLHKLGPVNILRLNIFPDGGIARFRAYGESRS